MATDCVILDTCVLYPMPVADTLLLAAQRGLFVLGWTRDIFAELERVMLEQGREHTKARYRIDQMVGAFAESEVTGYRGLIDRISLPDADDRHVLAAATRSGTNRIVTFNLAHFPSVILAEHGIVAQHPDQFLQDLAERYPREMLDLLRYQVSRLTRSRLTLDQLLERLEQQLPWFVADIRRLREGEL